MSANFKASTNGTQAIIGVGGVDQMTVSNAGVVTANSFVGLNGSSVTATGSTTPRTLANRFADVVNVKDFGAVGDGIADDTVAFQAAANAANVINVPSGLYKLTSAITANGKHFILYAASISGVGNLGDAIVTNNKGNVLAVGRNGKNAGADWQGLQIGGADNTWGTNGVVLGLDESNAWLRFQPSKNESAIECLIYSTSAQGEAQSAIGTNQVTYISGTPFNTNWVGKFFYFGEQIYKVASVSGTTINLTDSSGGAFTFGSTFSEIFQVAYISGSGICNVNGTSISRISGDPFIPFVSETYSFKINGSPQTLASFTNRNLVNISANLGTLTNATYEFEATINHQISSFRLQKILGSNEENLSIYSRYDGYWIHSLYAGSGKYRKIVIGSGESTPGELARQIVLQKNGDITIGGDYGDEAIRVINNSPALSANRFETKSAASGFLPSWRVAGSDTDIGMNLDTKGIGSLTITQDQTRKLLNVYGVASGTNFVFTSNSTTGNAVSIGADSTSLDTNVDVKIITKGTGLLSFGSHTASADAPITGYIQVKDSSGVIRKLAVIA